MDAGKRKALHYCPAIKLFLNKYLLFRLSLRHNNETNFISTSKCMFQIIEIRFLRSNCKAFLFIRMCVADREINRDNVEV